MTHSERQRQRQWGGGLTMSEEGGHNLNCAPPERQLPPLAPSPVVCFGLRRTTRLHRWCLKIARSPWLHYISILVILLKCATLGMYKPYEEKTSTEEILEVFVFTFFMVEMLIKMAALGVSGSNRSYLSNNWNKFDLFINFGEMLDFLLASLGFHLHISPLLGPMRLIRRVPSMKGLVTILVKSGPMLVSMLIFCFFVIHVFAIMGVQLWAGQLRNRCFLGEDVSVKYNISLSPYYKYGEKIPFICSPDDKNGVQCHRDVPPLRVNQQTCPSDAPLHTAANLLIPDVAGANATACVNWHMFYNVCRAAENPRMGAINFDNIGFAWITIFQAVSLEGWTEIMLFVLDANSFWIFPFFILVTIIGSFIMMNVCAVVIATQFSENMTRDAEESAVSVQRLCAQLAGWLQGMYNRCQNRVHPNSSSSMESGTATSILAEVWIPAKRRLVRIVKSKLFDHMIMFALVLNGLTMVTEHHGQPEMVTRVFKTSDRVFIAVFFVEMVMKLLALSWTYFHDRHNIIDFFIVLVSSCEVVTKGDGMWSALRAVRVLRFVRLLHYLPYLRKQVLVLQKTVAQAAGLCKLLLFVSLIFSTLGMQLFGGKFTFETNNGDIGPDRPNFDTLLSSMVAVFQILTVEDWNLVLYNGMAATSPWAALYFIVLIVFGKHILLNILIGVVVESFRAQQSSKSAENTRLSPSACPASTSVTDNHTDPSTPNRDSSARNEGSPPPDTSGHNRFLNWIQKVLHWCKEHEDWSFYVLPPQNRFRVWCQRVTTHWMFDHVILFFIIINSVFIAMERPGIDPKSMERRILLVSGYIFFVVFLLEMLIKVLAVGLVFGRESYCQSTWNVVDGSLVILSLVHIVISLASQGDNNMLGILKVLRLLRTLRPLRVVKRARRLKQAVNALLASVKPIRNIILLCVALFLFFAILGVQLFKGKFYYCQGLDTRNITTKSDCLAAKYHWVRKTYNFDNVPQALMSLFVMYSKDGWVNIMHDGMDAVAVNKQPVINHNEWMLLFFIPFMIMSVVLLDMFVGVLVETFHECQQAQKREDERMREEGEKEQAQLREANQAPYYSHYSPMRRSIHALCTSNFLELFMLVIIITNVLTMGFQHYDQPQYVEMFVEYCSYLFITILTMEVLLKLVAFGPWRFLKISWNLVDTLVVLVSVFSVIFNKMKMANIIAMNPTLLSAYRVLILARALKVKCIQVLLKTTIKTLLQVGNLCLLFMFIFFIYAALGVELFGKLECTADYPCLGLHRYANFRHFGMALLTLYQVCTGDNWSLIMKDTLRECRPHSTGCSSLSWASPIYFISFVVLAQFVLVNLVVAVIMQALEDSSEEEEDLHRAERVLLSPHKNVRITSNHVAAETNDCTDFKQ